MAKVTDIGSPSRPASRRKETLARKAKSRRSPAYWEKAAKAYELKVAGKLPSEIAEILEISDLDAVYRMLAERLAWDASYLTDQERKSILGLELIRLEHLQAAVWPSAMMGDPKAIDSAIRIIATRAKITGLEQVDPVVQKNLVLVMGEKEEDYIKALKAAGQEDPL